MARPFAVFSRQKRRLEPLASSIVPTPVGLLAGATPIEFHRLTARIRRVLTDESFPLHDDAIPINLRKKCRNFKAKKSIGSENLIKHQFRSGAVRE